MTDTAPTTGLTVLREEEELVTVSPEATPLRPGETSEHAGGFFRRMIKPHNLDVTGMQEQLNGVQTQVDQLLVDLAKQTKSGFHLKEVEVMIGISGQGSIGVVTAGVQASLTLIYSRE